MTFLLALALLAPPRLDQIPFADALDWARNGARHNPFDEPPVVAVGSGGAAAAKGAHCAAAPPQK